jgi:hypothetical protein
MDGNLVVRHARALAGAPTGEFYDGAEDLPLWTIESPWEISDLLAQAGSFSYRATGETEMTCASLTTPPLVTTVSSALRYGTFLQNIETDTSPLVAWDGGIVEVSEDLGESWSQLSPSPPYPSAFESLSLACTNEPPGAECYAGNSLAWQNSVVDLARYRGQEIMLRFRFATDESWPSDSWWLDELQVSGVAEAACMGAAAPPGEVSAPGAARRLTVVKDAGGDLRLHFAPRTEALGYNLYQGDLLSFYNHGSTGSCDVAFSDEGPDHLSAVHTPGAGDHYFYITAWNGDPVDGQEGTAGAGSPGPRPPDQSTCPPANNN